LNKGNEMVVGDYLAFTIGKVQNGYIIYREEQESRRGEEYVALTWEDTMHIIDKIAEEREIK
jgi:hypothetical protein